MQNPPKSGSIPWSNKAKRDREDIKQNTGIGSGILGVIVGAGIGAIGFSIGPQVGAFSTVSFMILGSLLFASRSRRPLWRAVQLRNEIDFGVARALLSVEPSLQHLAASPSIQSHSISVLGPMSLGEVQRHFDADTTMSIQGWMEHRFWLEGWGVGVGLGRLGIGVGKLRIPGISTVDLAVEGTSRTNLMADGFVAVFETHDGPRLDVVRVVCPSEPAVRQIVQGLLSAVSSQFGEGSHTQSVADRISKSLVITTDVSHVSDRLHAVLRMATSERLAVHVAGSPITEHAFLGSAVWFEGDERWYRLVPIGVLDEIANITSVALSDAASG